MGPIEEGKLEGGKAPSTAFKSWAVYSYFQLSTKPTINEGLIRTGKHGWIPIINHGAAPFINQEPTSIRNPGHHPTTNQGFVQVLYRGVVSSNCFQYIGRIFCHGWRCVYVQASAFTVCKCFFSFIPMKSSNCLPHPVLIILSLIFSAEGMVRRTCLPSSPTAELAMFNV